MEEAIEMLIEDSAQKLADSKDESPEERIQRYIRYLSDNGYNVSDAAKEGTLSASDFLPTAPVPKPRYSTVPIDVDLNFRITNDELSSTNSKNHQLESLIDYAKESMAMEIGKKILSESNFYQLEVHLDRNIHDYGDTTVRVKFAADLAADSQVSSRKNMSSNYGNKYADKIPFESVLAGKLLPPKKVGDYYPGFYPDKPSYNWKTWKSSLIGS